MKKVCFVLVLFFTISSFSQDSIRVEKSIFGVQTGFFGFWTHNESRISDKIALRTELGLDLGFSVGANRDEKFVLIPSVRVEPRWYYNLGKRSDKGKNIKKNSANFLALNTTWNPDFFFISNEENIDVISTLAFIPKWGIKRMYGSHFTFETGIGLGYVFYL